MGNDKSGAPLDQSQKARHWNAYEYIGNQTASGGEAAPDFRMSSTVALRTVEAAVLTDGADVLTKATAQTLQALNVLQAREGLKGNPTPPAWATAIGLTGPAHAAACVSLAAFATAVEGL